MKTNLCKCGCGAETKAGNMFVFGHQNRGINNPNHHSFDHSSSRSVKIKKWREAVMSRDDYICQDCLGESGQSAMHAHHIKARDIFPELKYDVDNGITLCIACHTRRHPATEELRRKRSEMILNNPTRRKMGVGNKSKTGLKDSDETKAKKSLAMKGKHPPNYGKKDSDEVRLNKRIARLKYLAQADKVINLTLKMKKHLKEDV